MLAWLLACSSHGGGTPDSAHESDADTDADSDTDTDSDVPDPISADDLAAIEAEASADMEAGNATGCQIAVWYDGRVAYHWELGTADAAGTPVSADMLFEIGSDTKKLTAMALLQQEAAGTLARTDTLASVLPDFEVAQDPAWSHQVTLEQLVSHQGETYDYTPFDPAPDDSELRDRAYGVFAKRGWVHAPGGSFYNYSNTNFSLAGLAIETASGRPFADVLQEDVIEALGLDHTFVRQTDVVAYGRFANGHGWAGWVDDPLDPFATSHNYVWGEISLDENPENTYTRPAGYVWSTATDMAALGGFFLEGDPAILSDADRLAMMTPVVRKYPAVSWIHYGLATSIQQGLHLADGFRDEPLVYHGGNTGGMTSLWMLWPDHDVAIAILSNGYGDRFTNTAIAILERLDVLGPPVEKPVELELPLAESDHALLVGTYVDPYVGRIEVRDEEGALKIAMPDLAERGVGVDEDLEPAFTDTYYTTVGGIPSDFTFVPDDAGTYRWIRSRSWVGTRVEKAAAPPRKRTRAPVPSAPLPPPSLAIAEPPGIGLPWL
jgi:CubicO group peptidase (beta-lactamase class C family)